MRSHADTGWRNRLPSAFIIGSCCRGTQMSGGSLSRVSPKNPGGATPITVTGWPSTTHAHPPAARLEGRNLLEFRCFCLEALIQREGNHAPAVLGTAFDATIVAFADAVEPARVRDGERAEHHGVNECKNCRGTADAQGQR